jgi:hypothetical protein
MEIRRKMAIRREKTERWERGIKYHFYQKQQWKILKQISGKSPLKQISGRSLEQIYLFQRWYQLLNDNERYYSQSADDSTVVPVTSKYRNRVTGIVMFNKSVRVPGTTHTHLSLRSIQYPSRHNNRREGCPFKNHSSW